MSWHAAVVHFPVALALVAPAVDAVGQLFGRAQVAWTGVTLFGVAALSSLAATATGQAEYDAAYAAGVELGILDAHADVASAVPWALLGALALRLWLPTKLGHRGARLGLAGALAAAALVAWAGTTGGALVYEHGVGTPGTGPGRVAPP